MGKDGNKKRQREVDEEIPVDPDSIKDSDVAAHHPPSKKARVESNRSLFIRQLPPSATAESLTEFFSQHFPVKHATVVLDPKSKTSRGYGFVTFTDPEDTLEAKAKLNNYLLQGKRLKLDIAEARHRDAKKTGPVVSKVAEEKQKRAEAAAEAQKPNKLIIRNLPWSIKKSEQLAELFKPYGKVRFADLPNDKGKLSGFGFVTLRGRKNAEKAIEAINGMEVDGRPLAVDWAVDKQTWDQQNGGKSDDKKENKDKKAKEPKEPKEPKDTKTEEEETAGMTQEEKDLYNFFKSQGENLESEDEEDEDKDKEDDEEDDEDKDEDDMEEGEEDEDEEEEPKPKRMTDNSLTLFIRNLPYTTTDEQLKAHFTQFGGIRYARVVKDRATDRPAGTGFVCFFNEEEMKTCLKGAPRHQPAPTLAKHSVLQDETVDPEGKYTFDGRILQVAHAVSKDEAERLAEASAGKKDKDKRRLYLLNEGQITPSSTLFKVLTPAEIKMREASANQRKKLIQSNPSLHLSLTRLALRNLPRNITSKELKALARQAVVGFAKDVKEGKRAPISKEENSRGGEQDKENERLRKLKGKGVVTQAKIVFETTTGTKVDEKVGGGKSRGYGFIEYSSHRWALMGLRYLNGFAVKNELGKTQRLIVEFAIENANVVQRRRQDEEKQRTMTPAERKAEMEEKKRSKEAKEAYKAGRKADRKKGNKPEKPAGWNKGKDKKGPAEVAKAAGGAAPAKEVKAEDIKVDKKGKKSEEAKEAMMTKILARKRQQRKKKANVRGKK
ncbi:RNA recognition motif-containing protein [Neurospora sp. IMI 360204]|nr:RNA recognition motif-containing protein [Neurospora sp. IMI 360204]